LGTVVFGLLSIVAFGQAHTAQTTVNQQKTAAATAARDDQKKQDAVAAEIAGESPFRSYIAPLEYGSFEIKFPKNWSAQIDEERSSTTQVNLLLHPDFVRTQNGTPDLYATKVQLLQHELNEYTKQFDSVKTVKRADITVSNIKGVEFTGTKFPDKRDIRIVAVPIRDKTLIFVSEDAAYANEFNQILAQSKILP
jgi:hypothetical protein